VLLLFGHGQKEEIFATNRKLLPNPILLNLSLQNKHNHTILLPNSRFFFSFSRTQHLRPTISSFFLPNPASPAGHFFFLSPSQTLFYYFILSLFFIYKKPKKKKSLVWCGSGKTHAWVLPNPAWVR
jgi:hypothetical protein